MITKMLLLLGLKTESTGAWGERVAANYLRSEKSFSILARNWRNPKDRREELDLVCMDREILVFVEVKTRSALSHVRGYDAVNWHKLQILRRAVHSYLGALSKSQRPYSLRFDVVEVTTTHGREAPRILHFENVPLLGKRYVP